MNPLSRRLSAAACAGASTGSRSFTALGALALSSPAGTRRTPDGWLGKTPVKGVLGLVAAQELVMDKLPKTPRRTEAPGAVTRLVGAAGSGVIVARRAAPEPSDALPGSGTATEFATSPGDDPDDPRTAALCALTAVAAAAATAWLGVSLRARCAKLVGHDWVGAVLEDAASVGLASAAVRLVR